MKKLFNALLLVPSLVVFSSCSSSSIKPVNMDGYKINPIYRTILDDYWEANYDWLSNRYGNRDDFSKDNLVINFSAGHYDGAYILGINYGFGSMNGSGLFSFGSDYIYQYEEKIFRLNGYSDANIVYKDHKFYKLDEAFDGGILDVNTLGLELMPYNFYDSLNYDFNVNAMLEGSTLPIPYSYTFDKDVRELVKNYINSCGKYKKKISVDDIEIRYNFGSCICYQIKKLNIYSDQYHSYKISLGDIEIEVPMNEMPLRIDNYGHVYTLKEAYYQGFYSEEEIYNLKNFSSFVLDGTIGYWGYMNVYDYIEVQ